MVSSIFATISAIFMVMKELLPIIKSVVAAIKAGIEKQQIEAKLGQFREAVNESKSSGDTTQLERMFNRRVR